MPPPRFPLGWSERVRATFGRLYGTRPAPRSTGVAEAIPAPRGLPLHTYYEARLVEEVDVRVHAPISTNGLEHRLAAETGPHDNEIFADIEAATGATVRRGGTGIVSIQAPMQISQIRPEGIPVSEWELQRQRERIRAEEDQRIFDIMDRVAAEGFDIQESRLVREVRDDQGRVTDLVPDRITDFSFVAQPTDPGTHIRQTIETIQRLGTAHERPHAEYSQVPVGRIYATSDPEFVGRMPGRREIPILPPEEPQGVSGIQGRRVMMPLFEIAANPSISLESIQRRRFDIMDRGAPRNTRASEQAANIFAALIASKAPMPVEPPDDRPEV